MSDVFVTVDSGKRVSFGSGMCRDSDVGKPRYDLIFLPMLKRLALLHARGVEKYGERNWELACTKRELARFKASAFRHFMQWFMDEDVVEDHAAAILFNVNAVEFVKEKLK